MASTSIRFNKKFSKGKKRSSILKLEYALKKQKVVSTELLKIELGDGKFLTVNYYNDQNYVHLRNYDGKYATKRGIALCPIRAKTLIDIVDNLDQEAESSWNNLDVDEDREYKIHLGYGTFLKVFEVHGKRFYDIRRWWKPEDSKFPVATKAGLCMTAEEFINFKNNIPTIEGLLPELIAIRNCDCWYLTDPNLTCERCFPFGLNEKND